MRGGGGFKANIIETGKHEASRFSRRLKIWKSFLMTLIDFKIISKANEGSNARNTLWGAGALSAENF